MSEPLPNRIMVWHGQFPQLTHTGTWATTRYPETAVPYVPEARLTVRNCARMTRRPPHGTGLLIAGMIAGAFWIGFALGLIV